MNRHTGLMAVAIAVMLVIGALGGEALASAQCTALGPNALQAGGECRIVGPITGPCPINLVLPAGEKLHMLAAGSLRCDDANVQAQPAASITISVTDADIEMDSGSEITAENTAAAGGVNGGNISITVTNGDFIMHGTGNGLDPLGTNGCANVAGACISSSDVAAGGGKAGNVTITVGNFPNVPPVGAFTMEPGSAVLANSPGGSGGEVVITAGLQMDVDGLVRSFGGIGGTGSGQPNGGGPITLKSGCALDITPDGVVSSEGEDPGADLVHLEGCTVTVNGLVQSIARGNGGHVVPAGGNRCNADPVNHPPDGQDFTACVEIWANEITINSIAPNKGEVSANGVTNNKAWIDLYAENSITINNDGVGPYSVHANSGGTTDDFGGLITAKVRSGPFTSSGLAIQANSTASGGDGGHVTIEASANVALGDSSIQARGATVGGAPAGGTISARSFNGFVMGNAPGELIATGGLGAGNGSITLQGCGNGGPNDGVNYTGTTNPAAVILADACGGAPTLPAAVSAALTALAPVCGSVECNGGQNCVKSGRKFHDLNNNNQDDGEPGLAGWQICAFDNLGQIILPCAVTDASGNYEFQLACAAATTFTFCEVLQPNWTQTFPNVVGGNVVNTCGNLVGPGPDPLGAFGYQEILQPGVPSVNNDFGNFRDIPCKEDPDAACTLKVGDGGYPTVQAAYDAASDDDVICVFANTIENVELGGIHGNKKLTITQCTVAMVTAADNTKPVWTVSSTLPLTIIGPDAKNGTVGWLVSGSNHEIRGVRALNSSAAGIKITGDNNEVSFNSVTCKPGGATVGVLIEGDDNDVRGGTVSACTIGAQLAKTATATATGNSFRGATVRNNTGVGIRVQGPGNTLDGNRVYSNSSDGILVESTATGTNLKSNQSGNPENTGDEYDLEVDAIDLGGNRADGVGIPSAAKCSLFPAAGTCE
ncbi:MAG: right-handed parallel beta-helix repeat-containing protein [Micromonosporaceae bacterium]